MDDDYKHTDKDNELMDKLGVSYQWRDSCVHLLIDLKKCKKNDYFSSLRILSSYSTCHELAKMWERCEFNRELQLASKFFTNYEKKEKEYFKK
jgi:hypothetical protein